MKNIITITIITAFANFLYGQQNEVKLTKNGFDSFNMALDASADSAFKIATVVLNSNEFKDSILKYNFSCKNYGSYCAEYCNNCRRDRINGQTVLNNLYRQKSAAIHLFLNSCGYEFGHSSKDIFVITSCYEVIRDDEHKLPFAYCYAYHLCHEYMHIVGFFHYDKKHNDDIAEKVGWIAYRILMKWYEDKKAINF